MHNLLYILRIIRQSGLLALTIKKSLTAKLDEFRSETDGLVCSSLVFVLNITAVTSSSRAEPFLLLGRGDLGDAVVVGRDEGHLDDLGRRRLAARRDLDLLAGVGERGLDVRNGDLLHVKRRRGAARGDDADLVARGVEHQGALARGGTGLDLDAHELLRGALSELLQDRLSAQEATLTAAAGGDDPKNKKSKCSKKHIVREI